MKQGAILMPARFLLVLISLLCIIGLLFSCLRSIIINRTLFEEEYTRLNHAAQIGMNTKDLVDATMQMIGYMEGEYQSIDITVTVHGASVSMFNDRESAHMVDVRALYLGWRTAAYGFLGAYALMACYFLFYKKRVLWMTGAFIKASFLFLLLLLLLGAWVLMDFNSFWTAFHLLFFTNDLWLLDPATSRMINMMPLELFYSIVLRMAARFLLVWGGALALCCAVQGLYKRNMRRASANGA